MTHFVKLYGDILDSSIWHESHETVRIWITLLCMADEDGFVHLQIPGIAHRAHCTIEQVEAALAKFQSPDPYSRWKEHEGRRIEFVDCEWPGYRIINHRRYRDRRSEAAQRKADWRERKAANNDAGHCPPCPTEVEAEVEAENSRSRSSNARASATPKAKKARSPKAPKTSDAPAPVETASESLPAPAPPPAPEQRVSEAPAKREPVNTAEQRERDMATKHAEVVDRLAWVQGPRVDGRSRGRLLARPDDVRTVLEAGETPDDIVATAEWARDEIQAGRLSPRFWSRLFWGSWYDTLRAREIPELGDKRCGTRVRSSTQYETAEAALAYAKQHDGRMPPGWEWSGSNKPVRSSGVYAS